MTTQEERKGIIGGSDIAAIMGLSKFQTPLSIWAEKTGKIERDLSAFEYVQIGTELEPYVCKKFERATGIKLRVDNRTFRHKQHAYMVAHIDRWVVKEDAGFEAKTCSAWLEKDWDGEEIPKDYILQCMWYMGIVGKKSWYIAVLIGGQKFRWKKIEFDQELFDQMVAAAKYFKEEFVDKDLAPMAQAGDSETLTALYPESDAGVTRDFSGNDQDEMNELVESRLGALESLSHLKEELEKIDAQIKQKLGSAEAGVTDKFKVTWKTQKRKEYLVPANSFRVLNTKRRA